MRGRGWQVGASVAVVGVVTVVCFLSSLDNGFVNWDDNRYVTENGVIKELSWSNLKEIFSTPAMVSYVPLVPLTFSLEYALWGLNPFGYHLTNLLLHTGNTLLVFVVVLRLSGQLMAAVVAALLFGVHPLHVEPVAWISSRKDVLSTFFWFATMGLYLRYVRTPSTGRFVLVLLSFTLGMLAKPMLMTLPFALLLLDYWPLNRLTFQDFHTSAGRKRLGEVVLEKCVLRAYPTFLSMS